MYRTRTVPMYRKLDVDEANTWICANEMVNGTVMVTVLSILHCEKLRE